MANTDILKNIYLFKKFDNQELNLLSKAVEEKSFSAGQDIFVAGQEATSFFVIRMGTVKVYSNSAGDNDINIATMGSGSHFGELPFLDGGKRSATAQTTEPSTLLEINFEKLREVLNSNDKLAHKMFREFSFFLANRLRATTENLKHVHELKLKHF